MEKFEIFKLRLCKGLFDGIISDYILADNITQMIPPVSLK